MLPRRPIAVLAVCIKVTCSNNFGEVCVRLRGKVQGYVVTYVVGMMQKHKLVITDYIY